jgi:hypothetical protein
MALSERELEENEAKLDNILHKIVHSAKQIQELRQSINLEAPNDYNDKILDEIVLLSKLIEEMATLADDIDVTDEHITRQLEGQITDKLDEAISRISAVKGLL